MYEVVDYIIHKSSTYISISKIVLCFSNWEISAKSSKREYLLDAMLAVFFFFINETTWDIRLSDMRFHVYVLWELFVGQEASLTGFIDRISTVRPMLLDTVKIGQRKWISPLRTLHTWNKEWCDRFFL